MDKRLRLITAFSLALLLASCTAGAKKKHYSELADRYYKAGEYDKARIEYMNLIRVDPQNANAYARLGAIWADDGAPLRAGAFLLKALELAPEDNATRRRLARIYLTVGRLADARKEALTLLHKTADDGEALLVLVDASKKPEEIAEAEQQVAAFPQKQSPYFHLASAGLAAKRGDPASVEAALQRAVAADPNLPLAHAALASWYRSKRDFQQAGAEFERAASGTSPRSTERLAQAEFEMERGAVEKASQLLKNITSQAPDFLPAWSLLARIANRDKKYDEALRLVQNVLSRDPANIEARVVQAESWLGKNETKNALDSLESLDQSYPQTPMIKYALARAYLQSNNTKQALAELDEVVQLSPAFVEAVLLRSELYLKNGDAQSTVQPLEKLAKAAPDLAAVRVLLAQAYGMLGRFDEARRVIEEQIKRFPQNPSYQSMLGMVLRQENKIPEARKAFEKAVELSPTDVVAIGQLVELDLAEKAYPAAEQRVEQLLQKLPRSAAAYYLQGKVYFAEGKFDLAQTALLQAVELDSEQTAAYELLTATYVRANKLPEALERLNAILARKPNDMRALLLSGLIYDQLKDSNKARGAYEKVLALAPNFVPALNNLAYLYAEKFNDLNRASELAQKARSVAPANPSVMDTLGWILYRQGDYQQAADLLEQSASKSPDNAEIQFHLGMANYMMGRSEVARAALEKAANSPAEFPGKEEARRRLAMLQGKGAQSAAELEALLKAQPDDPIALFHLGEAYEREGAPMKAAEAYERALKANPKLGVAAIKLAQLNAGALKNPEKALQYAKKARELSPADPKITATVGAIALQLKNAAWAYSLLQESARELPNDPAVLHDLASAAFEVGKTSEAQQRMQRVIELAPNGPQGQDARTFLAMTNLLPDEKHLLARESEVEKVLAGQPNYLPALFARATILIAKGDPKGAAAVYSQILERAPDFAPAQRDLAALLIRDPQNAGEAYELANKAHKTLPADPKLATVLARISYERKEFARAIQLLEQVQRQQPLDPVSLYYLGMSQAQAKRTGEARDVLNRALEQGLGEPEAADARRTLAAIGER